MVSCESILKVPLEADTSAHYFVLNKLICFLNTSIIRIERKFLFVFLFLFIGASNASIVRMTRPFYFNGEKLFATFISNAGIRGHSVPNETVFEMIAGQLDFQRMTRYFQRERKLDLRQVRNLEDNLFAQEPLYLHDEVLYIHRRLEIADEYYPFPPPYLIGNEILGILATDRLGHKNETRDFLLQTTQNEIFDSEKLLLEHRLRKLNLIVPRPNPVALNKGVEGQRRSGIFPHWHPNIASGFFQRAGTVMEGDVLQVNALYASKGMFPLLHLLANVHGLFSTGRIIPRGEKVIINGQLIRGPKVLIPTKIVWEVFNKTEEGKRKEGTRTRYYKMAGGKPLIIGGREEWFDPRLGGDYLVQIMSMSGFDLRVGWTKFFYSSGRFRPFNATRMGSSYMQYFDNYLKMHTKEMISKQSRHHPNDLNRCLEELLGSEPSFEIVS